MRSVLPLVRQEGHPRAARCAAPPSLPRVSPAAVAERYIRRAQSGSMPTARGRCRGPANPRRQYIARRNRKGRDQDHSGRSDGRPGQRQVGPHPVDERRQFISRRRNQLVRYPDACGHAGLLAEVSVGVLRRQRQAGVAGGDQKRVDFTGVNPGELVRVGRA